MGSKIFECLTFLYDDEATASEVVARLTPLLELFRSRIAENDRTAYFDETDAILITYGDMVRAEAERPLRTLYRFLKDEADGVVEGVHLLPFFPYSSDDGFSVIDYLEVDPDLGSWADVEAFGDTFRLMFDAVINHVSRESTWFQAYLRGEAPYTDYFVEVEPGTDLHAVFRPRALPLLTRVETSRGEKLVWTTFSEDQIDLNFASPDLLLEILEVLLSYVSHGAELIRLDAIAFMWKEVGTNCLHHPKTHALIQLMRAVLDEAAPQVVLITETNVPHEENISYFGNGRNEAQMVYNFSLPPLTLHAFHTGNAEVLSRWASKLTLPSDQVTFFNFLASHDGIGVTPARGLLTDGEVLAMARRVEALGGYVSYRNNPDGTQSAYELNINYLDALGVPEAGEEPALLTARRFLAAQAIMLALRGVPGIYFHSLFGSRGWRAGAEATGRARTINRQKLEEGRLRQELARTGSLRQLVFDGYSRLLQARRASAAFHPTAGQEILALHPSLFAVRRTSGDGRAIVLCLQNVSEAAVTAELPDGRYVDLLTGVALPVGEPVRVGPYEVLWLNMPDTRFVAQRNEYPSLETVEIETERLRLRPVEKEDAADVFAHFDAEVTRYMGPAPPQRLEETMAFVARSRKGLARGDNLVLAITSAASGEFLGICGLHGGQGRGFTPELGIWLKTAAHGQYYGREAIRGLVDWARQNLQAAYFIYPVDRANIPSRKIAEALGGAVAGEEEIRTTDGRVLDILVYRVAF